jgi:predicted amidophosphoribosyltransferase
VTSKKRVVTCAVCGASIPRIKEGQKRTCPSCGTELAGWSIDIDDELYQKAQEYAKKHGLTLDQVLNKAIEHYAKSFKKREAKP